jgi:hypothetical protein
MGNLLALPWLRFDLIAFLFIPLLPIIHHQEEVYEAV